MHPPAAPPHRLPAPHNPPKHSTLAHPAQRPASDALRHTVQGMPAWMQKAKQAGNQTELRDQGETDKCSISPGAFHEDS